LLATTQGLSPASEVSDRGKKPQVLAIFQKDKDAVVGRFLQISETLITVEVSPEIKKILRTQITKISALNVEKNAWSAVVPPIVASIYAGKFVSDTQDYKEDSFFLDRDRGEEILKNIIFVVVGVPIAYLVTRAIKKDKDFNFGQLEETRQKEWRRLKRFLGPKSFRKKIHLSVHAAHVIIQNNIPQDGAFTARDFGLSQDATSRFNILRRLQISYSLNSSFEAGAMVGFLGEPKLFGFSEQAQVFTAQSLEIHGYHLTGAFHPFSGREDKRTICKLGLGLGINKIKYDLRTNSFFGINELNERRISTNKPGALIFTELGYFLSPSVSIGLAADYFWFSGADIAGIPDANIADAKLSGNGSIGLAFGLHF
jgi:hypothetical protein